jgi:2-polyprenyl-6-methoxyphenol hydroxylase-like FAD-dependent oxidoreductase
MMRPNRADGEISQYGKKLASIAESPNNTASATFSDGTVASALLIIGCDGANSLVRKF